MDVAPSHLVTVTSLGETYVGVSVQMTRDGTPVVDSRFWLQVPGLNLTLPVWALDLEDWMTLKTQCGVEAIHEESRKTHSSSDSMAILLHGAQLTLVELLKVCGLGRECSLSTRLCLVAFDLISN